MFTDISCSYPDTQESILFGGDVGVISAMLLYIIEVFIQMFVIICKLDDYIISCVE